MCATKSLHLDMIEKTLWKNRVPGIKFNDTYLIRMVEVEGLNPGPMVPNHVRCKLRYTCLDLF